MNENNIFKNIFTGVDLLNFITNKSRKSGEKIDSRSFPSTLRQGEEDERRKEFLIDTHSFFFRELVLNFLSFQILWKNVDTQEEKSERMTRCLF